jgi:hypothetical protein
MMNWILGHADGILLAVTTTVSAASAIAALTPTPKDDNAIRRIRKGIDVIALNFGHAKKAE